MRLARAADVPQLVTLMAEYYRESDLYVDQGRATSAFHQLIADPKLGRVWLIEVDTAAVGYIVLTLGFSLEYGGLDAFVDDLFVRAPYRRRGLGREALDELLSTCRELGVRAVHLEVSGTNNAAQHLYQSRGFEEHGLHLRTLTLQPPVHR